MDPQTGEPSSLVDDDSEEQESAEGPALSFMGAMTVLTCITVLVAAASDGKQRKCSVRHCDWSYRADPHDRFAGT